MRQREEGKAWFILLHIGFRRGSAPAPLASAPTTAISSVQRHVIKSASAPDIIGAQTGKSPIPCSLHSLRHPKTKPLDSNNLLKTLNSMPQSPQ